MDEMVLQPADHVTEEQTAPEHCPWLERGQRGFFRSWFATIGMSMVRPLRLIRAVPPESPQGAARSLAFWNVIVPFLVTLIPFVLFIGISDPGEATYVILGMAVGLLICYLLAGLWALITHAMLRMTGGCAYDLKRTFQVFCYSSGPMIIVAVPCIGPYLFWYAGMVWWAVSAILMTKETHSVHGGRATLAVLTFPGICLLTCITAYGILLYSIFSSVGFGGTMAAVGQNQVPLMNEALLAYEQDKGAWPQHAILLADGLYCEPLDFVTADSDTTPQDVPLANGHLDTFSKAGPAVQERMIQNILADLPEDVVAHRLGDFVFTYHGIDPDRDDGRLWIVIMSEDPDASEHADSPFGPEIFSGMVVGKLNWTTEQIDSSDLQNTLDGQNELRKEHGLPPLPWPSDVRHDRPWTPDRRPHGLDLNLEDLSTTTQLAPQEP